MVPLAFCISGDLSLPTGGYRYDREVLARLPREGVRVQHRVWPASFPFPSGEDLAAVEADLAGLPAGCPILVDGLALGACPPQAVANWRRPLIALVHHPLGLEAGLPAANAEHLLGNEKAVLAHARHVVVTSRATAVILANDFEVPSERITIAEPGVDRPPPSLGRAGAGGHGPVRLLAVGAVSVRKSYDRLVKALAPLAGGPWRLVIAGALDRAPEAVGRLRAAIAEHGLQPHVRLAGAVDDAALAALYDGSDVFVSASLFEGYGMALAEAIAHGLPVVASTGGAAGDTVPDGAALKVPPGDDAALAEALQRVIAEPDLRGMLAMGARAAADRLPTWDAAAAAIARVVRNVHDGVPI